MEKAPLYKHVELVHRNVVCTGLTDLHVRTRVGRNHTAMEPENGTTFEQYLNNICTISTLLEQPSRKKSTRNSHGHLILLKFAIWGSFDAHPTLGNYEVCLCLCLCLNMAKHLPLSSETLRDLIHGR